MALDPASIGFGFLAGMLSALSPCVLPLLPLVIGGAMGAHRFGAAALIAGLILSFTGVGLFVATIGFSLGLDGDVFRAASAVVLGLFGLVLLSGALQQRFAIATSGVGQAASRLTARISPAGLGGQFAIGVVLGAVWSPCVGPTLGAASVLAARGNDLPAVAAVMLAFGLGVGVPIVVVASLSREALRRWRGRMIAAGSTGKYVLGGVALTVSVLILTGADRMLETVLVNASPVWLTTLTTRF